MKFDKEKFKLWVKETQFPLLIDFFKWKFIDARRLFTHGKKIHLYGIWCFVGIYGGGKTVSLVNYLEEMRKKYNDSIYISTNFFYLGQDFPIEHWKDIAKDYDKPIIFAYDELQNEFNSREYKNFPIPLMHELTQNRKGNGKQIVYTTQNFGTVDKNFRQLTTKVVTCRTILSRLTRCRYYLLEDYENLINVTDVNRKMKIRPYMTKSFVQSDYIRNLYDSYKRLDSVRNKDYMDRVVEK